MAFQSQHPPQYMPQYGNGLQPPFGHGAFPTNAPGYNSAPPSFNELPLSGEQGPFASSDFASGPPQNYDQPQNTGYLRGFSSQLAQLENRMDGRLQEIRLRIERAESSATKLENAYLRPPATDRALESRLESVENQLRTLETSLATFSRSLQGLDGKMDSLDLEAGEAINDAHQAISILIDVVKRGAPKTMTELELEQLQQYQKRGQRVD